MIKSWKRSSRWLIADITSTLEVLRQWDRLACQCMEDTIHLRGRVGICLQQCKHLLCHKACNLAFRITITQASPQPSKQIKLLISSCRHLLCSHTNLPYNPLHRQCNHTNLLCKFRCLILWIRTNIGKCHLLQYHTRCLLLIRCLPVSHPLYQAI